MRCARRPASPSRRASTPETVLITGGAGFIGSHLSELLLADGWEVFVLDDVSTGSLDNVAHLRDRPDFHLVVDSVLSPAVVSEVVSWVKARHLVVDTAVTLSPQAPISDRPVTRRTGPPGRRRRSWTGTPGLDPGSIPAGSSPAFDACFRTMRS